MQLHTLKPALGAVQNRKRIGRGSGSGKGGTATKGHKGAKSRSGYKTKIGFEGGQLPLKRRIPKYGFKNPNRKVYKAINLDCLQHLAEKYNLTSIDTLVLKKYGLLSKHGKYKVLGSGLLNRKLNVAAHAFSAAAMAAIRELNGEVTTLAIHE